MKKFKIIIFILYNIYRGGNQSLTIAVFGFKHYELKKITEKNKTQKMTNGRMIFNE